MDNCIRSGLSSQQICLCRYELLPWLGLKLQMQLAEEKGMSQVMLDGEFKVCLLQTHCSECLVFK